MDNLIITDPLQQTRPHESRSSKYQFISTKDILEELFSKGWHTDSVDVARSRKYQGYQKHIVRLGHPDLPTIGADGKVQLILRASHSGQTKFEAFLGAIIFACSNGLIVGTMFESLILRHIGTGIQDRLFTGLDSMFFQADTFISQVRAMKAIALNQDATVEFANKALELRWGKDDNGKLLSPVDSTVVLEPRREEDSENTVWSVYNRVQENLVKGGLLGATKSNRIMHTRAIRSIDTNVSLNRGLYDLAASYLQ